MFQSLTFTNLIVARQNSPIERKPSLIDTILPIFPFDVSMVLAQKVQKFEAVKSTWNIQRPVIVIRNRAGKRIDNGSKLHSPQVAFHYLRFCFRPETERARLASGVLFTREMSRRQNRLAGKTNLVIGFRQSMIDRDPLIEDET